MIGIKHLKLLILSIVALINLFSPGISLAISKDDRSANLLHTEFYDPNSGCSIEAPTNLNGNDNIEKAFRFFISKGLSGTQSAGIVGNMMQESGVDPQAVEGGSRSKTPTGPGGWGISQWTPGTKVTGIAQGLHINGPIYELSTQLDIVWGEVNGTSPTGRAHIITTIKSGTTVEQVTTDYMNQYEAPNARYANLPARIKYAHQVLTKYGGSATPATAGADSGGGCADVTGPGEDTKFIDGFAVYSQFDPAWKDKPYSSSTIGASGCGPSAMAMVVTALTGKRVTPVQTANYAASRNLYVPGQGSSWSIGPVLAEHWGLKAKPIGANIAKITSTLQAGGLVITSGQGPKPLTSGGHFIVIRGVTSSGKWKVGDSGHNDTSDKEWDPKQLITSMNDGSVYAITK